MNVHTSERSFGRSKGTAVNGFALAAVALVACAGPGGSGAGSSPSGPSAGVTTTGTSPGAAAKAVFSPTKSYKFTIAFANGCPQSVDSSFKNCSKELPVDAPGQDKDCARVQHTETVTFESSTTENFLLQFDPFGKTFIPSEFGKVDNLHLAKPTKQEKPYTFWVIWGSCPPLDPQIIVDN